MGNPHAWDRRIPRHGLHSPKPPSIFIPTGRLLLISVVAMSLFATKLGSESTNAAPSLTSRSALRGILPVRVKAHGTTCMGLNLMLRGGDHAAGVPAQPGEVGTPDEATGSSGDGEADDGVPVGGGWYRYQDEDNQERYYHNVLTGATQWEAPDLAPDETTQPMLPSEVFMPATEEPPTAPSGEPDSLTTEADQKTEGTTPVRDSVDAVDAAIAADRVDSREGLVQGDETANGRQLQTDQGPSTRRHDSSSSAPETRQSDSIALVSGPGGGGFRHAPGPPLEEPQGDRGRSGMIAGLDVFDSEHAGVLGGYAKGILSDAFDKGMKPVEAILGGIVGVSKVFGIGPSSTQETNHLDPLDPSCGPAREEWQIIQGYNDKVDMYMMLRHRRFGTCIELCERSEGSFNFQVNDASLVRRCIAITEFELENRDWLFHPALLDELRRTADTDQYCIGRYANLEAGPWTVVPLQEGILIKHRASADKNNVIIALIPDGFVFVPRGNIDDLARYRTRDCIVVRKGAPARVVVPFSDARELLLRALGPVPDVTHFGGHDRDDFNAPTSAPRGPALPASYNHLLEEGERLAGHSRSLEETWSWRGRRVSVAWTDNFLDYAIDFLPEWSPN